MDFDYQIIFTESEKLNRIQVNLRQIFNSISGKTKELSEENENLKTKINSLESQVESLLLKTTTQES